MKTIVWKGITYNSLEYFKLTRKEDVIIANSKIIGTYENNIYAVEYNLDIESNWKVTSFEIEVEVNSVKEKITGAKKDKEWSINKNKDWQFTHFDFIDISLTPFTNTLPIRNLDLNIGQEKEINVIYIDILEAYIKPVKQKYRRNHDQTYTFENVPNDFSADIRVDEFGLVTFYPTLFERIAESPSYYCS